MQHTACSMQHYRRSPDDRLLRAACCMLHEHGFSLLEVIVVTALSLTLLLAAYGSFLVAQRSYRQGDQRAELLQNGRAVIERLSRELRQAEGLTTVLPAGPEGAATEIEFQDGHSTSTIQYLRYYRSDSDLYRQRRQYAFAADPGTPVIWDARDGQGNPPMPQVLEDRLAAEHLDALQFWGTPPLINLRADFEQGGQRHRLETTLYARNLP